MGNAPVFRREPGINKMFSIGGYGGSHWRGRCSTDFARAGLAGRYGCSSISSPCLRMASWNRQRKKQRRLPMKQMKERTALGEAILKHWREHCPQMVRDLEKENRLDQSVFETQERTGDLLYELVSVKKMDYHAAWELAAQEWALPGEDRPTAGHPPSGTSGPGKSRSATSSRNRSRGRRRGTSG